MIAKSAPIPNAGGMGETLIVPVCFFVAVSTWTIVVVVPSRATHGTSSSQQRAGEEMAIAAAMVIFLVIFFNVISPG
jgi:hypothetical protein